MSTEPLPKRRKIDWSDYACDRMHNSSNRTINKYYPDWNDRLIMWYSKPGDRVTLTSHVYRTPVSTQGRLVKIFRITGKRHFSAHVELDQVAYEGQDDYDPTQHEFLMQHFHDNANLEHIPRYHCYSGDNAGTTVFGFTFTYYGAKKGWVSEPMFEGVYGGLKIIFDTTMVINNKEQVYKRYFEHEVELRLETQLFGQNAGGLSAVLVNLIGDYIE